MRDWLAKYPGHPAMTLLVQILIGLTGVIVLGHMTQGHKMPEGYGEWFIFLGALAGVNVGAMGVRRTTDYKYQEMKNAGPGTTKIETEGTTHIDVGEQKG
jgi:hypothetical protein